MHTQCFCLFEYVFELAAFFKHFCENVITGTVDNACDPLNPVTRQTFAYRFDDGNTTGNRRFKGHTDTVLTGCFKNICTMACNQCFVGSHYMLAVSYCRQQESTGRLVSTHRLNYDVDLWIVNDRFRVVGQFYFSWSAR